MGANLRSHAVSLMLVVASLDSDLEVIELTVCRDLELRGRAMVQVMK